MEAIFQSLLRGRRKPWRRLAGLAIAMAGFIILIQRGWVLVAAGDVVGQALAGGLVAALATTVGAIPVLFARPLSARWTSGLLGFGAGVMLAATAFSLIVPGIASAENLGLTPWAASGLICFGIMLGAFGLYLVDLKLSGASPEMLVGTPERPVIPPRIWLFVFAIIAHNIPEGMAVGVSAGGGMPDADSLAMGIALQDVPEGLVIALVLAGAGMSRVKAFLIGAASGLVEPVFALLCAWLVSLAELLLPLGLALAAGAMLLVVTHEVIPESRRNGHDKLASIGLLIGFCLMMVMDTALG